MSVSNCFLACATLLAVFGSIFVFLGEPADSASCFAVACLAHLWYLDTRPKQ